MWEHWASECNKPGCTVRKVKAHAEKDVLEKRMPIMDFLGNALADATADAMVCHQIDWVSLPAVERYEMISYLVAHRLAVLEAEYRNSLPEMVEVSKYESHKETKVSLELQVQASAQRIRAMGKKKTPQSLNF